MKSPLNSVGERALFFSIWAFLFVLFGLWKFWPQLAVGEKIFLPDLSFSSELHSVIESGSVVKTSPSRYFLELSLSPQFMQKLAGSSRILPLSYDLIKNGNSAFSSTLSVSLVGSGSDIHLELSNPNRVSAEEVRLHLAR